MHRSTSAEAALTFDDEYFDWVYIDGDHSYEAVLADLRAFAQGESGGSRHRGRLRPVRVGGSQECRPERSTSTSPTADASSK